MVSISSELTIRMLNAKMGVKVTCPLTGHTYSVWSVAFSPDGYCVFLQAEDGIRDFHVTGVQTCALPICPHPYPWMVREFQRIVGDEAREQCRKMLDGRDPDYVVACVGGGSNAAGTFAGFADTDAKLVGVEAAGGAAIGHGVPGIVHGMKSFLLQDEHGQVSEAHSISAGLDYPGV